MKEIKAVASAAGLGFLSWGISQLLGIWAPAAGLGFLSWGISRLLGILGITKIFEVPISWIAGKMMKAPGRDGYILREVFERDPAGYFRNLRN